MLQTAARRHRAHPDPCLHATSYRSAQSFGCGERSKMSPPPHTQRTPPRAQGWYAGGSGILGREAGLIRAPAAELLSSSGTGSSR